MIFAQAVTFIGKQGSHAGSAFATGPYYYLGPVISGMPSAPVYGVIHLWPPAPVAHQPHHDQIITVFAKRLMVHPPTHRQVGQIKPSIFAGAVISSRPTGDFMFTTIERLPVFLMPKQTFA
jgi:hypothetical protein